MYIPRAPPKEEMRPMRVQKSWRFLCASGAAAVLTVGLAGLLALHKIQERTRLSEKALAQKHCGQRVVIIGAGAGGSALASVLCNAQPSLQVTVIEKERRQVFQAHVPLAHVGHRSYDLNTTGGIDTLRSPTTWNVTREARLIAGDVVKVLPKEREVLVYTGQHESGGMPQETLTKTADAVGFKGWTSGWTRSSRNKGHDVSCANADGSTTLRNGLRSYPYDVLILACGAERTLGYLAPSILSYDHVDRYRIAVNPGVTRDNLAHLYQGPILHVKVPPASFVERMEAHRRTMNHSVECVDISGPSAVPESSALANARTGDSQGALSHHGRNILRELTTVTVPSTVSPSQTNSEYSGSAPFHLLYASRQHDGTFISTTNTLWKYLDYYNKLHLCPLFAVTADQQPSDALPLAVNNTVLAFWARRQQKHMPNRTFFFLPGCYLTHLDQEGHTATFYNYLHHVEVRLPYRLLVLDLPLRGPSFVRASGLHPEDGGGVPEGHRSNTRWYRWKSILGTTAPTDKRVCAAEETFADVDPATLQHRRYENIFALGDIAGLPTVKSYGAVLTQVPVVAHNVQQVLYNLKDRERAGDQGGLRETEQNEYGNTLPAQRSSFWSRLLSFVSVTTPSDVTISKLSEREWEPGSAFKARAVNACYNGYSSFSLVMTTWRAMWPEMQYPQLRHSSHRSSIITGRAQLLGDGKGASVSSGGGLLSPKVESDVSDVSLPLRNAPLDRCDHHLWNNLAWEDMRGFLNGVYYQMFFYELMYFFIFQRGLWHPPTWFYVPTFSPSDGAMSEPSPLHWL